MKIVHAELGINKLYFDDFSLSKYADVILTNSRIEQFTIADCNDVFVRGDTSCLIDNMIVMAGGYGISAFGGVDKPIPISSLMLQSIKVRKLTISSLATTADFHNTIKDMVLDTISIENVSFKAPAKLNLNTLCNGNGKVQLHISNTNVDDILFEYSNCKLYWQYETQSEKEQLYIKLLEKFKREGLIQSYDTLDVEYKAFLYLKDNTHWGRLQNWGSRMWWYYGYEKDRIITNSLVLFVAVILLNLFAFRFLFAVYEPENFKYMFERLVNGRGNGRGNGMISLLIYRLRRIPGIVAYSTLIFWGIKLDLTRMKFEKWWWPLPFFIILVEYITGLACLAYLANLVITKV